MYCKLCETKIINLKRSWCSQDFNQEEYMKLSYLERPYPNLHCKVEKTFDKKIDENRSF